MKLFVANSLGGRWMKINIASFFLGFLLVSNSYAANWVKLQDNKHAKLMLDKQSITQSGKYQKAWVKIQYKTKQKNIEYPDKYYNKAKLLWYFQCEEQKSASVQVYQLLDDEQIFSAAIDVKRARFIEPVPETEIDLAMRYACKQKLAKDMVIKKAAAKNAKIEKIEQKESKKDVATKLKKEPAPKRDATVPEKETLAEAVAKKDKEPEKTEGKTQEGAGRKAGKASKENSRKKTKDKKNKLSRKSKRRKKVHWTYVGDAGPEFWGDLSPDFAGCSSGRNQSPINIEKTIATKAKPLKVFQRFPVKGMLNNGQTIQANFKAGNVLALDGVMYQMKHVSFHTPSENTIEDQSFPLEVQFVHKDPKGNLAILAVMFEEGPENKGLKKLWEHMPKKKTRRPKKLKVKVLPSELIPRKKGYYRFSGSLTEPPCTEGVIWVVKKATMTASQSQIRVLKETIGHANNRPLQPLNGRVVIE